MKKVKFFKRLVTLLMACVLCCFSSTVAFAASSDSLEHSDAVVIEDDASNVTLSAGDVLYAKTARIYNGGGTVSITTTSGNFDADFIVSILGNPNTSYTVELSKDGSVWHYYPTLYGNGYGACYTRFFAPAGTYTISVQSNGGDTTPVDVIFQICD